MKQQIKNWLIFWITWWITMLVIWVAYAAVTQVSSWQTLTADLFNQSMTPTWMVAAFNGMTCPAGWTAADWSGDEKTTTWALSTLDLRDEFIRGTSWTRTLRNKENATAIVSDNSYWQQPYNNNDIRDYDERVSITVPTLVVSYGSLANRSRWFNKVRPRNVALLYCVKN